MKIRPILARTLGDFSLSNKKGLCYMAAPHQGPSRAAAHILPTISRGTAQLVRIIAAKL